MISKHFILTSGRCFENRNESLKGVYVISGNSHDLENVEIPQNRRKIKTFQLHPDFAKIEKERYQNNLALVELAQPLDLYDANIYPACLIEQNLTIKIELLTAGKQLLRRLSLL